ncbi:unnamed protein product [Vitrella brassicaformis CCMP3155]|uniref:Uncharacterized protein n=1 Tax=Vitrella brassicaformis (strain CCMP3155) TaxID=1169540 RepID=A0A0G4GNU6_VITBC|nr:unnamed protein product [Vitrella brassicaformis CCMP3155]|eukprot:CEM31844.1 unnamed protein product [Vitrella brassicaformis CCMP3155]
MPDKVDLPSKVSHLQGPHEEVFIPDTLVCAGDQVWMSSSSTGQQSDEQPTDCSVMFKKVHHQQNKYAGNAFEHYYDAFYVTARQPDAGGNFHDAKACQNDAEVCVVNTITLDAHGSYDPADWTTGGGGTCIANPAVSQKGIRITDKFCTTQGTHFIRKKLPAEADVHYTGYLYTVIKFMDRDIFHTFYFPGAFGGYGDLLWDKVMNRVMGSAAEASFLQTEVQTAMELARDVQGMTLSTIAAQVQQAKSTMQAALNSITMAEQQLQILSDRLLSPRIA